MLLEMAVADAYAIPFEFVKDPKEHGLVNTLERFQQHPRYQELRPSQYTDDTLRSIATADVVLNAGTRETSPFDPFSYVARIQANVLRDRRKGWSKRFQQYLEDNLNSSPKAFLTGIKTRADSNGAIMGCLPLGYLPDPIQVRTAAAAQAIATHSVVTVPYAQAMALSAHYFLHGLGSRHDLFQFLKEECEGNPLDRLHEFMFRSPKPNRVSDTDKYSVHYQQGIFKDDFDPRSMKADYTATVVLDCIWRNNSLEEMLWDICEHVGGDTDSIAALAVGIASCSNEFKHDLPQILIDGVDEYGQFGADYLRQIDQKLAALLS